MNQSSKDASRFVIAGMARSGTTAIQSIMTTHEDVKMPPLENRVSPLFTEGLGCLFPHGVSNALRDQAIRSAFDCAAAIADTSNVKYCGLKVSLNGPLDAKNLVHALKGPLKGTKLIHIQRDDEIARLGSARVAQLKGVWHSTVAPTSASKQYLKLWISPITLLHAVITGHKANQILAQLSEQPGHLKIDYRDFANDNKVVMAEVANALGIADRFNYSTSFRKQLPAPAEYIVNYSRLKRLLPKIEKNADNYNGVDFSWGYFKRLRLAQFVENRLFQILN